VSARKETDIAGMILDAMDMDLAIEALASRRSDEIDNEELAYWTDLDNED
jgi:hypothetical protein